MLIYYALRTISWFFCILPFRMAMFIGKVIGLIWYHLIRVRRRTVIDNLRISFPEWPMEKVRQTAREVYIHLGFSISEFLYLPKLSKIDYFEKHIHVTGEENLEAALAKGKGLLVLTAHLGNWEVLAIHYARKKIPISMVSRTMRIQGFERFWRETRSHYGLHPIGIRDSIFDILSMLKEKMVVAFVLDQHEHRKKRARIDFLNRPAWTSLGLALVAARSGAPVLPAFTVRRGGDHFVEILPPMEFERSGDLKSSIEKNTTRFVRIIEERIRKDPGQWLWLHRRWKP